MRRARPHFEFDVAPPAARDFSYAAISGALLRLNAGFSRPSQWDTSLLVVRKTN
jgi:hypothetical protein